MDPTAPQLIDQVRTWLDDPASYATGLTLYEQLPSCSSFLLTLLGRGPDDFNRAKLRQLLEEWAQAHTAETQARAAAYPDELKNELQQGRQLMDLRVALKERLRSIIDRTDSAAVDERKAATLRILEIGGQLSVIYGRKLFYDNHGYFPEEDISEPATEHRDPLTRRNTLRTYVSRLQRELGEPGLTLAQHQKKTALLARYSGELRQLTLSLQS